MVMSAERWLHNPVTGELAHLQVTPADTANQRLEGDLWLQPGAAVMGEHTHSALVETFSVIDGSIGYRLDGHEGVAGPGEEIHIPVGARHDWWNAGSGRARARFLIASADPAVPMAARFESMIETAWGLAALGKTNANGMPEPLWLAPLSREYRDVLTLVAPPPIVQALVLAPLAVLGRATGHDPLDASLHGDRCPANIPPLDPAELDERLARFAPSGSARA
jgi:quercetin dioxygenase-like cupin family protein